MEINDIIVIGSGCCGSIVAKTIIENGGKVTLLDVGIEQTKKYTSPENNFVDIRSKDSEQWKYLLGENFEALKVLNTEDPLHLTPNRFFVTDKVSEFYHWIDNTFNGVESLAIGGLGNAWGLGSYVYSKEELLKTGLPVNEINQAYLWLHKHIGISGGNDSAAKYSNGNLFQAQNAIPLDYNGERLYKKSQQFQKKFEAQNVYIGRAPLAVSTDNDLNGEKHLANDLEFYETENASAFRPINIIKDLIKKHEVSFNYIPNQLVLKFIELEDSTIKIESLNIKTNIIEINYCKKLIIASGALATARIVMRSTNITQLPILCNPYSYIPSIQPKLLGSKNDGYQTGLAQLSIYYDKEKANTLIAMGSVYSYRALMNYRLLREFPIGMNDGTKLLKYLQPALNITGIFHPEESGNGKNISLINDSSSRTGDKLKCNYPLSETEKQEIERTTKKYKSVLRKLGTLPLMVKHNKIGSSIHYGGTLPFNENYNNPIAHNSDGKLLKFKNVYIADGSGFKFLSGKGLTLTLMAYAHHVTKKVIGK